MTDEIKLIDGISRRTALQAGVATVHDGENDDVDADNDDETQAYGIFLGIPDGEPAMEWVGPVDR